jgi:hypothetical protein
MNCSDYDELSSFRQSVGFLSVVRFHGELEGCQPNTRRAASAAASDAVGGDEPPSPSPAPVDLGRFVRPFYRGLAGEELIEVSNVDGLGGSGSN